MESFINHTIEDRVTKNNKKHVYSLYENVQKMDPSVCGIYLSYAQLRSVTNENREIQVDIPVNIPITNLLIFQSFTQYPNKIFGDLKIEFQLNMNAFVWCIVDPCKSLPEHYKIYAWDQPIEGVTRADEPVSADDCEMLRKFVCFDCPRVLDDFNYGFNQASMTGHMVELFNKRRNPAIDPDDPSYQGLSQIRFRRANQVCEMTHWEVHRCVMNVRGCEMDKRSMEEQRQRFTSEVFAQYAQRITFLNFNQAITATNLKTSCSPVLNYVTDFIVLFPKSSQQLTCFENPMLQNLQLAVLGRNFPERGANTVSPIFVEQQLIAADFLE